MCCLQNLASECVKLLPIVSLRISNDSSCLQSVMKNYDSGWYNQIEKVYFSHVFVYFYTVELHFVFSANCVFLFSVLIHLMGTFGVSWMGIMFKYPSAIDS